jgi:hypothetical protein
LNVFGWNEPARGLHRSLGYSEDAISMSKPVASAALALALQKTLPNTGPGHEAGDPDIGLRVWRTNTRFDTYLMGTAA